MYVFFHGRKVTHNFFIIFFADKKFRRIFAVPIATIAEIAQLVERNLAKVEVAGPNPVFRSKQMTVLVTVILF